LKQCSLQLVITETFHLPPFSSIDLENTLKSSICKQLFMMVFITALTTPNS